MTDGGARGAWIALAAICVIWGTTFLAIKIALETIPPFLMGGIRYVIGGGLLALGLVIKGQPLPPVREWGGLAWLGFLLFTLGNGGVVWSERYIASGLAAVVLATSPFWMVAIDAMLPNARPLSRRQVAGLVIFFLAVVALVFPELAWPDPTGVRATGGALIAGVLLLQVAAIGWAIASAYTRRHAPSRNLLGVAAVQMCFGGGFMLVLGTMTGEWDTLSFTPRTLVALAYLTVFGATIAFSAYSHALRHLPIATVSLYNYVNPIVAVGLGALVLGEPLRASMAVSAALIVLGVLVGRPARRLIRVWER